MNVNQTKTPGVLSLTAREQAGNGSNLSLPAAFPSAPNIGREPTPDEQCIIEAMQRQSIIIAGTAALQQYRTNTLARLNLHAAATFDQTAGEIMTMRESGRGLRIKDHQAWVDLFTEKQMELFGTSVLAGIDAATQNITAQGDRSIDVRRPAPPPPPPPRRRGILERLFGEDD